MQGLLGKPRIPSIPLFVFDTQPPAKPPTRMLLHGSVGVTDRTQAEVVNPTINLPVERCYQRRRILLGLTPAGHLADRLTQTLHSFLGGSGAPIGPPRLRRVASTKRVPEKIELLFRQSTDQRLAFVHRQLQLQHHVPHQDQCLIGSATTTDHEIIGIINDVRFQALLVTQRTCRNYTNIAVGWHSFANRGARLQTLGH
jgi:hypothetical protein